MVPTTTIICVAFPLLPDSSNLEQLAQTFPQCAALAHSPSDSAPTCPDTSSTSDEGHGTRKSIINVLSWSKEDRLNLEMGQLCSPFLTSPTVPLMRRRRGSTRGYAHSEDLETGVRRSGATERQHARSNLPSDSSPHSDGRAPSPPAPIALKLGRNVEPK